MWEVLNGQDLFDFILKKIKKKVIIRACSATPFLLDWGNLSSTRLFNPFSAGVFSKIVFILPKFIKTSNADISRSRPIWTLGLG